jgi:hypothetical protein
LFHSRQNHKSKNVIYSLGTSHRRWVAGELVKRGWQVIHIIERGKVWIPRRKHLQCCDDRMDSRGAGGPACRQAGQTPKSLGLRIIRSLREAFVVIENEVFIGLRAPGVNPQAVPPCLRRSACPPQGFPLCGRMFKVWRRGFAQAGLNLSPLACLPLWI